MKLKNHPEMKNKWPPGNYAAFYDQGTADPILSETERVIVLGARLIKGDFYFDFRYENGQYSSGIPFADPEIKKRLTGFLNEHKGKSLKEVLDLDFYI